jgi:pimeloyl-ACP methyl ester carboxylesterase
MADGDYRRVGKGAHAVIALHGWFGSAGAWQPIWPYLDGETFTYLFLDCRGYGARRGASGDYTIAEAAADVLATANELGLEQFSLVGHSMGGSVMQRVYADAPSRVRAMVGVSPVPASGVPFDEQSWQLFSSATDSADSRRAIIDFTTGNRLTSVWLDAMVRHSLENSDRAAFAAYLTAWARTDFHQEIMGSEAPIKVIAGENDPALGAGTMQATFQKYYPKLELEVFPNAGHYAIDETPVALVTAVERFLKRF